MQALLKVLKKGRDVLRYAVNMVARDGIEPPTPAFSGLR